VTDGPPSQLRLTHQVEHDLASGLFSSKVLERGDTEVRGDGWATSARELPPLGEPLYRYRGEGREFLLLEADGVLLQLNLFSGNVYLNAAARSVEQIDALLAKLRELLPVPDPSARHEVTVTFWTYGPHGPQPAWRTVAVPEWGDIEGNYAASVREQLEPLMRSFQPARGGQLVL